MGGGIGILLSMNDLIRKTIDVALIVFAYVLASLLVLGLFVAIDTKYYEASIYVGVPSVIVLLYIYTKHWVRRWRKE